MNEFFNTLSASAENLSLLEMGTVMLCSLISGLLIGFTYYYTNKNENISRNFILAIFMLPIIMSVIILFVGSNVATAFSLAGTVSIIRFRSTAGDPKDIGYIFFSVAAGLCAGIGYHLYGIIFVILLCAIMIIAENTGIMNFKNDKRMLKITIPEDLNYHDTFADIFDEFTKKHVLHAVKTADLGSVFILTYHIVMKGGMNEKEMLDKIRCRNANLDVIYSEIPQEER